MALSFTGQNPDEYAGQAIDCGHRGPSSAQSFSVSVWVRRVTGTYDYRGIITKNPSTGDANASWWLEIIPTNTANFGIEGGGLASWGTTLATSTWYHLVGVANEPNDEIKFYTQGTLRATVANTVWVDSDQNIQIARTFYTSVYQDHMVGYIADVRLYNRILTLNEIQSIYATRGLDTIIDGLVLWYPMVEGPIGTNASGSGSIKDYVGTSNGTPVTDGSPPSSYPTYIESQLAAPGCKAN